MKQGIIFVLILFGSVGACFSQEKINLNNTIADSLKPNVTVQKLMSDQHQSSFLIWVNDTVKPHYHKRHSESIYIIEGSGIFYIGKEKMHLKAGDFFLIPQGIIHSYKNTGTKPSKVLSIQTPEFAGKDRIWVEKQE
ncbi:MAG: cupin domain-containing protein [Salibacteraceae bacterium]